MDGQRRRLDFALLATVGLFTLLAVAGYASFGRHPGWVSALPAGWSGVYAWAFGFFAQGQVWLAGVVLAIWLSRHAGRSWLLALGAAYGISLVAELGGTGYGVPFGGYTYSNLLGPAWLGRVPVVIPLSWFCMALPSWVVSFRAYPDSVAGRVLAGSFILLVWDLALDPAMSHATRFWAWQEAGPYYGMPLLNLLGWFVTGALIVGSFEALGAARWARVLPRQWLLAFYAVNLLMPLGMSVAAGLWGAVLVTAGAVLGVSLWIRRIELLRARGERPAIGLELAR